MGVDGYDTFGYIHAVVLLWGGTLGNFTWLLCLKYVFFYQGKVKQIVGSTIQDLKEDGSAPVTNFESDKSAAEFANLYKEDGLTGGHVIMIGADPLSNSAAIEALHAYPGRSTLS